MSNSIIRTRCKGQHEIRTGQKGDRSTEMSARAGEGKEIPASYVLLCNNQQVGAMDGPLNYIVTMKIFDGYRGVKHSEIFLELIEQEARKNQIKEIKTSTATGPIMKKALERCGFVLDNEGQGHKVLK